MLRLFRSLLEMIRFSHTLFAMPFALTSAALAWRLTPFHWLQLVGILLCMVFARSAAMAFNRLADREIDARNPRTETRHLPAGRLTVAAVWSFFLLCSLGFLGSTSIFWFAFTNPWPAILALPVLLFICGYSYAKRFTALAHFWLGVSLMLAPLSSWIAIRGIPDLADLLTPLVLGGAVLFWVSGFDILYACQDEEFDRKARLRSIPALLGIRGALTVALLCHLVMLVLLFLLPLVTTPALGWTYLIGITFVALLLVYEHSLVRADDLSRVNQAFFQVNVIISIGLFALVLVQLALPV